MSTLAGRDGAGPVAAVIPATRHGRRRRPSGEPPPLPRAVTASTAWYVTALLATAGLEVAMGLSTTRRWLTDADDAVLRVVARLRAEPVTAVLRAVEDLGSAGSIRVIGWTTIALLLVTRRLRHLITYLAVLLSVVIATGALSLKIGRMRPTGVSLIGPWQQYSHPSAPVALFAAVAVGAAYTLVPAGRAHRWVTVGVTVAIGALGAARLYLGVDHPTDVLAGLGLGAALSMLAYRVAVPHAAFPVQYRRGRTAHLDVTGPRGAAIIGALEEQLGITADSIEAFGLEASAGSTPLRIRTRSADGAEGMLFGKLYALNHLRSDRSYKLARMMLYGRLEDEKPFATVRRLVEYEDHMLRLLRDAGLPVPAPYGFVEITPEREYVIVMGFVAGAHDLASEPVGEQEIDEALLIVRRLWQAGVAHRDIKPSNLLAKDGHVELIDVAFAAVRPTPWRQAVDLANMMLTLALASEAEVVYRRATKVFAPADIAEAFAASRSVTIPTQLRTRLRDDHRDLIGAFRALAPERPPVPIQLWSVRRVAVSTAVLAAAALAALGIYTYAQLAGLL